MHDLNMPWMSGWLQHMSPCLNPQQSAGFVGGISHLLRKRPSVCYGHLIEPSSKRIIARMSPNSCSAIPRLGC